MEEECSVLELKTSNNVAVSDYNIVIFLKFNVVVSDYDID